MEDYNIYAAGQAEKSDNPLEVTNPYTGEAFARTYNASPAQLERAIQLAKQSLPLLAEMPVYERHRALKNISTALAADRDRLAKVLATETAKPLRYALGEVDRAVQTFDVAAEECRRLPAEYLSLDWTPAGAGKEGLVKYFPLGIVAGITPFNFPLNLVAHKVAPALAAGCPVIIKPAPQAPLSALELARIMAAQHLPEGAFSVLPMEVPDAQPLITDERIAMLSFTGSPQVGWMMKDKAGKKKVMLELGGNAGIYISDSCELDKAAERCVLGAFAYSGQVCIHTQRIYVHSAVMEEFKTMFLELAGKLKHGDPLDTDTEISNMIDEENAARVQDWVIEALDKGARLLLSGQREGAYFPPTVLSGTNHGMKVCREEVF
ncbi:MAG: aldehyde dehydrogenase family protein, partial [Flavobacteriales bacterium]